MSESSVASPVRVGVVGLGRRGLFLLERWLDRNAVRVVAACDRDAAARERASTLCGRVVGAPSEVFGDEEVDAVVLAVPAGERAALGRQAVAAGKHVVCDPPVADSAAEVRRLFRVAEAAGRSIGIWSPWREEEDFLAALATVRSGLIGSPRLMRFERWEPMVDAGGSEAEVPRPVVGLLDQLVALAGEPAATAYSVTAAESARIITVAFPGGLRGVLTLHAAASARIDHGWAIDAERGGYAAGRRWVRTEEGELYEVPAEAGQAVTVEEVIRSVVAGGTARETADEAVRLAALIAAVARSEASGRVERVEETG